VAVSVAGACGGSVNRRSAPETGGAPGSGGGAGDTASSGGDRATSGGETANSGGQSGGNGGEAGTDPGQLPPDCTLPPDPGPCEAYIPSYYYDPETQRCEPFVYGGCDGNGNNFATLADCEAACGSEPRPRLDECRSASDCELVPAGCCGPCEPVTAEGLTAINRDYLTRYLDEQGCAGIDCAPCPEPAPGTATRQNFGVRCDAGTCAVFDVRKSELATCSDDPDCRLRGGLGCCEDCTAVEPVAVSIEADVESVVCGDERMDCAACEPAYPADLTAVCLDGACAVAR
jgi:hypothetical protein